jgi:flagellar protein FliS
MHARDARSAYLGNSVETASPARLLVMLLERLVLDVERGLAAQESGDWAAAHPQLVHAQDIVLELASSLQPDRMPGGPQLAALYEFLRRSLVEANVSRDPVATAACLGLARDLCDTWRTAATTAVTA